MTRTDWACRLACGLAVIGAFALAQPALAAAEATPLRITVAVGPAFALGKAAQRWAELINQRGGASLGARVFAGATLAQREPRREFAALRERGADLGVGSSLSWSVEVPALAVASLPWMAPTPRALAALCEGDVARRLSDAVEAKGAHVVAIAPMTHRAIMTATDRVHTPADLAGMSVRIPDLPLLSEFYATLGARPSSMPSSAARDAAQNGTLEADDATPLAFVSARVDAWGLKYVTVWDAVGELAVFAVNRAAWEALGPSQRDTVREAAEQAGHELAANSLQESESALQTLRERGVTVTRLLAPAQSVFAASTAAMIAHWTSLIGAELVDAARAAVRDAAR